MSESKQFQVGDVIVVKNWHGTRKDKVTRVTKTMAICEKTNYTCRYKREYYIWNEETKRAGVTPLPRVTWNTTEYFVNP
jgi:hypothetical protein